jgi:hypothetical protein
MHVSPVLVLVVIFAILVGVYVFADNNKSIVNNITPSLEKNSTEANLTNQVSILVCFNHEIWNTTALQMAVNASHASIGAVVLDDYAKKGQPGLELVLLPPGMTAEEGIAYYEKLPYVKYAEPNAVYSIAQTSNQTKPSGIVSTNSEKKLNESTVDPARLLVQFNSSAFNDVSNLTTFAKNVHSSLNATIINDYTKEGLSGLYLVSLPKNITAYEGITMYKNQSNVLFAEPDYNVSV